MPMKEGAYVGILMSGVEKTSRLFLSKLVSILQPSFKDIYVVAGNAKPEDYEKAQVSSLSYTLGSNAFSLGLHHLSYQIRAAYQVARLRRKVDVWIYFLGGESLLLPGIMAKLLRKKTVLLLGGSMEKEGKREGERLYRVRSFMKRVNMALANRIVVYTHNLIKEWDLEKYDRKISVGARQFVDFDRFYLQTPLKERGRLVGYIGTLREVKGILPLLEAISSISKIDKDVRFAIIGDGELKGRLEEFIRKESLDSTISHPGWVSHGELPTYLNSFKLLVLPSYSEGLPNVLLEAMACGTPVLATPVGGVPDIVRDEETGFIMEDNSANCIARNIVRALNHPRLEGIAASASTFVEREFTYEAAVERYRKILGELNTNEA